MINCRIWGVCEAQSLWYMDYIQEIYSVLNDSSLSLGEEERSILFNFSDEIVRLKQNHELNIL